MADGLHVRALIVLVIMHPYESRVLLDYIYNVLVFEVFLVSMVLELIAETQGFAYDCLVIKQFAVQSPIDSKPFSAAERYWLATQETLLIEKELRVGLDKVMLNSLHFLVKPIPDLTVPGRTNCHECSKVVHIVCANRCESI